MTTRATAHDTARTPRLLVVVADGVRPDVLADEMDGGRLPALAALRAAGGMHHISSSFPSVTGPAYAPFVMGRHPAHVGMPGLRWYDRARALRWSRARSYSGIDIWHVDGDLDPRAPTLYDLATPSLAGLMMIARGATQGRIGRGVGWSIRAAYAHFRGDLEGWRRVEQAAVNEFMRRFERVPPRLSMLGLLSPDKLAHAYGGDSGVVRDSLQDIEAAIARARHVAASGGWGDTLHVWVVGDHGHASVDNHDDLHGWLDGLGYRVLAHPHMHVRNADIALMVGGNAMAHVYLELEQRSRHWWPQLSLRWQRVLDGLLTRPSVDLAAVAIDANTVQVHHARRGTAEIRRSHEGHDARWSYQASDGDPLQLGGSLPDLDANAAWHACADSPYPDAIVQLASLVPTPRGGDIVISAAPDWDLRARFEPTVHVSTHGALLREQMLVPLLLDAPPARLPQRTTDVVPSALALLGIDAGSVPFDGRSYL
ncbi:MAG: alkaline phosphatase family protein [Gemmatimonadaceae bacterium]|nr:alkaline phosphatase family protein [Gemmatimonadaceae bacterium]